MTSPCRPCARSPRRFDLRAVLVVLAVIIGVPLLPTLVTGCSDEPTYTSAVTREPQGALPTAEIVVAGKTLKAELCLDGPSREHGMKFRTKFPDDEAMLFVFPEEERTVKRFWMRDTLIPLDIMFLADDGTIETLHQNCPPAVEFPGFHSDKACILVLELRGGWAADNGLKVGDKVTIPADLFARAVPREGL